MTTNQKVISWRWHQRQANPSEWRQSVDVLPCVVPGEVPGGPRHILHASALRLCVLITRTEGSLGPNALNHTLPPPSVVADRTGWCRNTGRGRAATGWLDWFVPSNHHILLFQLKQWYMMLLWHFACFWEEPNVNKALHRVTDLSEMHFRVLYKYIYRAK